MLFRALLQTSLVLWLAQQTLQGGVKPQSVSWDRVLPARGVGVGVRPGVAGALGALGNRYGNKAMKAGIGRYPGAQLSLGGYRSLGVGGRAGLRQGGYGAQGAYGANLGTGTGMGTGLTNGLGLGLGQGGKRVYGAGHGTLPGYGAMAGMGYPGARPGIGLGYPTGQRTEEQIPGVSAADLGGPELASLGQAMQDLMREKGRVLALLKGKGDKGLVPETPVGGGSILGPTAPELLAGGVHSLEPLVKSSNLGSTNPFDKPSKNLGLAASQAQGRDSHEPTVLKRKITTGHGVTLAAGGVRQQLPLNQDNTRNPISASSQAQSAGDYDLLIQQNQRAPNCGSTRDLSEVSEINHREILGSERTQGFLPQLHFGKGNKHLGHAAPQAQREKAYPLPQDLPGYIGGAGNYLGANLGPGGYGAGLGQGAYLGGAAGKHAAAAALGQGGYPQGVPGYGDGATGLLGAAGNGYGGDAAKALAAGYGNGYSDGYGAGLGYPAHLADGAENKAGKNKALSTGGYAGQPQGAYGAGAAQVPYGNAPVIPAGLEGEGGYPYGAQSLSLSAEGAKTANKYGAAAGYGAQQTGYGAQLGAAQGALGEQAGKYGGVNGALGNGYKG
ncbi:fibroin heavy chain isoform X2 [Hippoglossus stenolepis]|uniref:fibroin heavy chain isoform X2 n=1 Tax=Hippoglossus stenolepis TaxID=195615 RepID=UPI00159C2861|nr:fibroin heavy chain isoform X2 [Hippoglossus stenolepis]